MDYLIQRDVNAELMSILPQDKPYNVDYDIAIRLSQVNSNTRIGVYSKLWWVWAARNTIPLSFFGDFYSLNEILQHTDSTNEHLATLHKINEESITYARFIPLWYLPHYELINTANFPWWIRQMSYHPLFPQWTE